MKIYEKEYGGYFRLVEGEEYNKVINTIQDEYREKSSTNFGCGSIVVLKIINDKIVIDISNQNNGLDRNYRVEVV